MRSYHNIEKHYRPDRRFKSVYTGYGADGYNYHISVFIQNRRDNHHWRAIPTYTHGKSIVDVPNYLYSRTLEEMSKKLENLK